MSSPTALLEDREVVEGLEELGAAVLDTRISQRVVFTNAIISMAAWPIARLQQARWSRSKVWCPPTLGWSERERGRRERRPMGISLGAKTCSLAHRVVVGKLYVWENGVPVVLTLVDGGAQASGSWYG